jgi:Tfp pilus assembly protein FimT
MRRPDFTLTELFIIVVVVGVLVVIAIPKIMR